MGEPAADGRWLGFFLSRRVRRFLTKAEVSEKSGSLSNLKMRIPGSLKYFNKDRSKLLNGIFYYRSFLKNMYGKNHQLALIFPKYNLLYMAD